MNQLEQARTLQFNDWHPVLHTLFLALLIRIYDSFAFIVFAQITLFSLAIGYLLTTLSSWGISRKWLLGILCFIILNPLTLNIMIWPGKDSAFTIAVTFLTAQVINIFLSRGEWVRRYGNILAFAVTAGIAAVVRHNGIFLVYSLLGVLLLLFFRENRRILLPIIGTFLVIAAIRHPLYSAFTVERPQNTLLEATGVPMTIMGDVFVKKPERLPKRVENFLLEVAPNEAWQNSYKAGNYNSIKWARVRASAITERTFPEMASMTFDAMVASPRDSFVAVCDVTSCVWNLRSGTHFEHFANFNNPVTHGRWIHFKNYASFFRGFWPFDWLFFKISWQMLFLLAAGLICCYRRGAIAFLVVFPVCAYVWGTGMLLCGPDIRFFHFLSVVFAPLILVLLAKQGENGHPQLSS